MSSSRFSRRTMLASTGASAFLLPLLNSTRGFGAEPLFPRRIIFAITGNGTIPDAFWPTTGTGAGMVLPEIVSPLEAHKQKLLFPKGIDMRVWAEGNPFGGNGDAHHNYGSILTGTAPATGDPPHDRGGPGLALASSRSIDHYIGEAFEKTAMLPFRVLNVRARGSQGSGYGTVSWSGPRAPFSAENDPFRLFGTLFAGRTVGVQDPALLKLRKKRQSVLDYVGKALERQSQRLGKDDKEKIQIHLNAIRSVEREVQGVSSSQACSPTQPEKLDPRDNSKYPELIKAQVDLVAAAMACNLTRVATISMSDGNAYDTFFPFLGITGPGIEFPQRHHHDISHRPGPGNRQKIDVEKWHISIFAHLLDKLAAVPEGGGTMLDNTVVLWMNALNSGFGHTVLTLPWIVAGGANVGFPTGGRVKQFTREPTNKLLAALATAVGVPTPVWGDPRFAGLTDLA